MLSKVMMQKASSTIGRRLYSSSSSKSSHLESPLEMSYLLKQGKFSNRKNFGINFLPSGSLYVVERFGKFHRVVDPGFKVLIPIIDKIAYDVDMRELCFRVDPEIATTSDNVMVRLGGNLYVRFTDAHKAAYGAANPIYSVLQLAQSIMRREVGNLSLDCLFSERQSINTNVRDHANEASSKWGCEVIRFEITELEPDDRSVKDALHKQSTAERNRKEVTITATASAEKLRMEADAYSYQQRTKAAGDAEKVRLNADAEAYALLAKARAEAEQVRIDAIANAERISVIATAMAKDNSGDTVKMLLSTEYIQAFSQLAQKSTSMIVPSNLTDLVSAISMGSKALNHHR